MKPKRLPRLWCALQGLLPLDACLAAQRGELAWPAKMFPPRRGSLVLLQRLAPREPPLVERQRPPRESYS